MNDNKLAKGLGWFSIGLGLTQLLAPGWLGRKIGVGERTGLMRALGAREAMTGVGVLMQDRPAVPMWGRVAGDLMDMALLAAALRSPWNDRGRVAGAAGMVLGVGLVDLLCARSLQAERY
ncbi:MAG: hypothetical protein ACJ75H_03510 [Thermoanaerobaculia bacterium]